MKKRMMILGILCLLAGISTIGCAGGTKEPLVRERKTEPVKTVENAENLTIAEQVKAPEKYRAAFSQDWLTVRANAPVTIPDVTGVKLKKATRRPFTEEEFNKKASVLWNNNPMWDYNSVLNGFEKEVTFDMFNNYESDANDYYIDGLVFKGLRLFSYSLDNYMTESKYTYVTELFTERTDIGEYFVELYYVQKEQQRAFEQLDIENNRDLYLAIAQNVVDKVAPPDMELAGEGWFTRSQWTYEGMKDLEYTPGYGFCFTHTVDGIPVLYYKQNGEQSWRKEVIRIVCNNAGLVQFEWNNPSTISDWSDENVFLLPFSDIQSVFEDMVYERYRSWYTTAPQDYEMKLWVDEVQFGYTEVANVYEDSGNDLRTSKLVPVWTFLGRMRESYGSNEERIKEARKWAEDHGELFDESWYDHEPMWERKVDKKEGINQCFMAINAMDGSIISVNGDVAPNNAEDWAGQPEEETQALDEQKREVMSEAVYPD